MNVKPFKAVYPKVDLITSPKSFFNSIKYQYREYRASGVYSKSEDEGFYIYRIKTDFGVHTGIICATAVEDLNKNKILPHEGTLAVKEQQMMHLLLKRKALVKPVLLGYYPQDNLHELINERISLQEPMVHIVFENKEEEHTLWAINDEAFKKQVLESFSKLEKAYIGDGHHRSTTVSLLNASKDLGADAEQYKNLLTAYFPFDQLNIWDFNRVVDIGDIMMSSAFMAKLSKYFKIKPLKSSKKPAAKHELTFYIDGKWYLMKWKSKYLKKVDQAGVVLDSALINELVFKNILGIEDVRTDTRIKYYGGTEPMYKLTRQAKKFKNGVALCIYPVAVEELTHVADNAMTLPPKSTFFLPRLRSGIIAKDL